MTEDQERLLHREYAKLRARQHRKGWEGEMISFETFAAMSSAPCFYCGAAPGRILKQELAGREREMRISGLDRIDSARGYIEGNVVPACPTCNNAKGVLTIQEFRDWLQRAARHQAGFT